MSHGSLGLGALCLAFLAACGDPQGDGPSLGIAQEAWCNGYTIQNVAAQAGIIFFVTPDFIADATEAWGPQLLSLSVNKAVSPQVTYADSPSVAVQHDKLTSTLQKTVGYSVTDTVSLTASTSVLVPVDAYYRVEAYPEYQLVDFTVMRDPCGPMTAGAITTGTIYRPTGVYFRVMHYVTGAWNAMTPPSPGEIPVPAALANRLGIHGSAKPTGATTPGGSHGSVVGNPGTGTGTGTPGGGHGP